MSDKYIGKFLREILSFRWGTQKPIKLSKSSFDIIDKKLTLPKVFKYSEKKKCIFIKASLENYKTNESICKKFLFPEYNYVRLLNIYANQLKENSDIEFDLRLNPKNVSKKFKRYVNERIDFVKRVIPDFTKYLIEDIIKLLREDSDIKDFIKNHKTEEFLDKKSEEFYSNDKGYLDLDKAESIIRRGLPRYLGKALSKNSEYELPYCENQLSELAQKMFNQIN